MKTGVHNPQFIVVAIRHFVDKNVACGVRLAGHITGIDAANWFAFLRNCRHVAEVGNMPWCADGENLMVGRQAHR